MKKSNGILCGIFLAWMFAFAICHALLPDRDFSEMENRYLSSMPGFTAEGFFAGDFRSDFETYLDDQFPFRDFFKQASTAMQYASGKQLISGVFLIGGGGQLIGQLESFNDAQIDRNIQSLNKLGENINVPLYTALIPDAACIRAEALPYGAPTADQVQFINRAYEALEIESIDVFGTLFAHSDEDIFYRTDHHWTSLGAYYGYAAIISTLGMEPVPLEAYSPALLSDDFYGTLYSKLPASWIAADKIYAYAPDMGTAVTVFDGREYSESSLYCTDNLENWNKYTVFLGGNQPQIIVDTGQLDRPRLLVLRDSYFDSLVPFLQPHFSQIHLIDVRYYRQDIAAYIEENEIDTVLAAYSVDQFANVMNLAAAQS